MVAICSDKCVEIDGELLINQQPNPAHEILVCFGRISVRKDITHL